MIWLDIVLLAPLLWGAYTGFKKGLIAQILGITSLIVGVWIGTQHQELIEFLIIDKVQEKYLSIACFIILFFGIVIFGVIVVKISEKFINFIQLKLLNKIAGIILGVIKILSFSVVVVFMIESWDINSLIIKRETKEASITYPIFKNIGNMILPNLKDKKFLDRLPDPNKLVI
jgi:membrane protein required for colicin V production